MKFNLWEMSNMAYEDRGDLFYALDTDIDVDENLIASYSIKSEIFNQDCCGTNCNGGIDRNLDKNYY